MTFAPTPVFYIIIGALIGMGIGWIIGFFDSNTRTSKKITAAEANAEKKIAQAEQKLALASQPSQQDDPGLLRLKKTGGRFMLELDGATVDGELSNDKRKRLIELITVFRLWLDGRQSTQAESQPEESLLDARMLDSAPSIASYPVSTSLRNAALPVPASLRNANPPVPVPVTLQSLIQTKKPDPEKNITSLSIVQQIDMVLQERLLNSPLAKQGIRLQESIQGGVEVYVGLNKFDTVDDVPDQQIKTVIRAAIAEWEKKYTPGM
jgi:hypothetical protein